MWILQARSAKRGWWKFSLKPLCLPPVDMGMNQRCDYNSRHMDPLLSYNHCWAPTVCLSVSFCQSQGFCGEELPVVIRADCILPGTPPNRAVPADVAIAERLAACIPRWLNLNWSKREQTVPVCRNRRVGRAKRKKAPPNIQLPHNSSCVVRKVVLTSDTEKG